MNNLLLRDVTADDLPIFFEQQLDPDANAMAAFTTQDPTNRDAFTTSASTGPSAGHTSVDGWARD